MASKFSLAAIGRISVTLLLVAAAILVGQRLWRHYEVEPWTRDGRVKAYVIQIAPDVTGPVVAVHVHDNQQVKAGDVLFEIDRARFELALRQAEASVQGARATLAQAQREARRNAQLRDLVAQEVREQGLAKVDQAQAQLSQSLVNLETAKLNLARTRVVTPVNGIVTNLDLRQGAYVTASRPVLALIDSDSFYVEGYFEETKLPAIHVGDRVSVSLMGQNDDLSGHVDSFAEGIVDRDRSTGSNLLPNVNPTFNWVRLAQRIPVRIAIDRIPPGVRLVAGQTATVKVLAGSKESRQAPKDDAKS
ncbi:RND family efflux transporter MFP subunit [Paucimonas lemoignei]|uniref:RND family efflux transporter MFP subunit n=1 Tax=Paucimonas lemoignei TaxID=29443 RepID=A0A4R3I2A7_PAULE|nr:HlyD family secretion protein [Paucimonas lemoignei]TCS39354.1 RND family efflux transporter MFP subunit [Paucimonas lemoignei]